MFLTIRSVWCFFWNGSLIEKFTGAVYYGTSEYITVKASSKRIVKNWNWYLFCLVRASSRTVCFNNHLHVKNKLKPISSHKDYSSITSKIFQNFQRAFLLVSYGSSSESGGEEGGILLLQTKFSTNWTERQISSYGFEIQLWRSVLINCF